MGIFIHRHFIHTGTPTPSIDLVDSKIKLNPFHVPFYRCDSYKSSFKYLPFPVHSSKPSSLIRVSMYMEHSRKTNSLQKQKETVSRRETERGGGRGESEGLIRTQIRTSPPPENNSHLFYHRRGSTQS